MLIKQSQTHPTGVEPYQVDVSTFPVADPVSGAPAGMSVLKTVPTGVFLPAPFVKGSKATLDIVMASIDRHFEVAKPQIVAEWKDWVANVARNSDDAGEYYEKHPLDIPFKYQLFGIGSSVDRDSNQGPVRIPTTEVRYRSTPCVIHRNLSNDVPSLPIEANDVSTGNPRVVQQGKYLLHLLLLFNICV